MESEGLWADVRRVVLRGDVFGLAIAVLVGTALEQLILYTVEYLLIPLARALFREKNYWTTPATNAGLSFTYHGYLVSWGNVLIMLLTLAIAGCMVVALRRRLFTAEEESQIDELEDAEFERSHALKKCPECLSDIPLAARRCSFCTAVVESSPLPLEKDEAP